MKTPILFTEESWMASHLSVVRHYGRIKFNNMDFIIVNKEGKDIFECSLEADREGRDKAIEPGEPVDLVDERYVPIYRELGREKFLEMLRQNLSLKEMQSATKNTPKP